MVCEEFKDKLWNLSTAQKGYMSMPPLKVQAETKWPALLIDPEHEHLKLWVKYKSLAEKIFWRAVVCWEACKPFPCRKK